MGWYIFCMEDEIGVGWVCMDDIGGFCDLLVWGGGFKDECIVGG